MANTKDMYLTNLILLHKDTLASSKEHIPVQPQMPVN